MRIKSISLKNTDGLDLVEVDGLADIVVFAGPNGVGKTRLIRHLIQFFQNPAPNPNLRLEIESTRTMH